MAIKDVPGTGVATDSLADTSQAPHRTDSKDAPPEESALNAVANTDDRAGKVRESANQLINSIHVASEAMGAIDSIVRSISGIVQQASSETVPENRLSKLEAEAKSLIEAIKSQVASVSSGHTNPLLGDPIRLEVEREIGRTLDFVLPNHAKKNFGLGSIDFSRKELIMSVRTSVERAQRELEELKNAMGESRKTVEATLSEVDVALQNSEAARATVRDLDTALELVGSASGGIKSNPKLALASYRGFSKRALELLE